MKSPAQWIIGTILIVATSPGALALDQVVEGSGSEPATARNQHRFDADALVGRGRVFDRRANDGLA